MGLQQTDIMRNAYENNILNLEKKYFKLILEEIQSSDFKQDLLLIEKEIKDNYAEYRDIWDLKNKIKVPAERNAKVIRPVKSGGSVRFSNEILK